jgi:hypothetical protein
MRFDNYAEPPKLDFLETPMDDGDQKRRPRQSLMCNQLSGEIVMTWAQYETFRVWAKNTLSMASVRFDGFPHPRTKATLNNVRLASVGQPQPITDGYYNVPLQLEYYD